MAGGLLKQIADRILGGDIAKLEEAVQLFGSLALEQGGDNGMLKERLAELELAMEDTGWAKIGGGADTEFSRAALTVMNRMARMYWLKNPLIKRAVYTQTAYVFGQGVSIRAEDASVDEIIQDFIDDPKNIAELTSHQARMMKETQLQLEANIFFTFFTNISTGKVRLRTIPMDQIEDIWYNPEDSMDPWYYLRVWQEPKEIGSTQLVERKALYPDFKHNPEGGHPDILQGVKVEKLQPIYHVKVNALPDMKFGVSEVYAAIDWARAYKDFLEDWATLVRALSRFAWNVTSKTGKQGIEAAKDKINNTLGGSIGQALPPTAGSTWMSNEAVTLEAIPKTGATTSADDGRRMLLMVSAATGIFEHYFGDPSTGNLATASAMERPMELMFVDRQTLWGDVFRNIFQFVIDQAIIAPSGKLAGAIDKNEYNERVVNIGHDTTEPTEAGEEPKEISRDIEVEWPPILEKDVAARIQAIVGAATLEGKTMADTIDIKTTTRMLLLALGENGVDALLEELFPDADYSKDQLKKQEDKKAMALAIAAGSGAPAPVYEPGKKRPTDVAKANDGKPTPDQPIPEAVPAVEAMYLEAVEELRDAISLVTS